MPVLRRYQEWGIDAELPAKARNKLREMTFQIFEKYDLVLQEAVFAGPRVDITEKVIKSLNAQGK